MRTTGKVPQIFTELRVENVTVWDFEGLHINAARSSSPIEVTTLLHGAEAAKTAEARRSEVFEKGRCRARAYQPLTLSAADIGGWYLYRSADCEIPVWRARVKRQAC